MKKPTQYDLKNWIYEKGVSGVIVHYYQTGTDTADTDWELISLQGEKKRIKKSSVIGLLQFCPDWTRLMTLRKEFETEVIEYKNFITKEAKEFEEYKRLKNKFES